MRVRKLLKLRAWSFAFFKMMIYPLTFLLYSAWVQETFSLEKLREFLLLLLSIGLYFVGGTLLNDFCDREYDLRTGKATGVESLSGVEVFLLLSTSISSCLLLAWIAAGGWALVLGMGLIFTALYSHPTPRLKERGSFGLLSNTLAELSPFLLIQLSQGHFALASAFFLLFYFFFSLAGILNHQLDDYAADREVGVKTFVVGVGYERSLSLLKGLSALTGFLFFLLSFFLFELPYFSLFFFSLLLLYFLDRFGFLSLHREPLRWPLYFVDFIYLGMFGLFPLYLSFVLAVSYPTYSLLLIFTLFCECVFLRKVSDRVLNWVRKLEGRS